MIAEECHPLRGTVGVKDGRFLSIYALPRQSFGSKACVNVYMKEQLVRERQNDQSDGRKGSSFALAASTGSRRCGSVGCVATGQYY